MTIVQRYSTSDWNSSQDIWAIGHEWYRTEHKEHSPSIQLYMVTPWTLQQSHHKVSQAKASFKSVVDANHIANSIVARAGKDVPKYNGTHITTKFITSRQKSWQNHLQRVSHYLLPGKDVWWRQRMDTFSDDDPITHLKGPCLRHHRSMSMAHISKSIWDEIVNKKIDIPTSVLQL